MPCELAPPPPSDCEGLLRCLRRDGEPDRVHHLELFLDPEVEQAIVDRYDLAKGLDRRAWEFPLQLRIRLHQFLGYDYIRVGVDGFAMPLHWVSAGDTAELARPAGRRYIDEHHGPIQSWDDFAQFPWPDPADWSTRTLEWYQANLPDGMCLIGGGGFAHFAEYLSWLLGYESLCYLLFDDRELVRAISDRLLEIYTPMAETILQFDRVQALWGSDDMGFKTGTLIGPDDLREFVLPGHRRLAALAHAAGRPYLLHSCGDLASIMTDLIVDVAIDAKHSFEDTIESVIDCQQQYGDRLALLGGIDVDFLCRNDEATIRRRVRETLAACQPGGGYCLGTGNSVANYIPLDHYLFMLDEGRRWRG